ncbi:MAG: hypothetical protein AVDCRST_MAG11-1730 [uncultured Gemmatimonadaceae bacterium]|uniref:Uncharacterized protein n=1 Tax=uncultured Gemmatimonadaceae bacterium TaxID=246130 RepID=A0A6J4KWK4_9BACT|nr:MAG: hypothetical protein AVDCRST_MAG11-1730 [uncultured Gemmatimonadaceae bacterium]
MGWRVIGRGAPLRRSVITSSSARSSASAPLLRIADR